MPEGIAERLLRHNAYSALVFATVTLIAAGGLWVWSIVDAGRAARRTNAKRAARASLVLEPTRTTPLGEDRNAVRLGVRISTW